MGWSLRYVCLCVQCTSTMFRSLDADKDGQIDVNEFMHWLRRPYALSSTNGKDKAAMAAQLRALQARKRRMGQDGPTRGHDGPRGQGQGPTTARSAKSDRSEGPDMRGAQARHRDLDDLVAMEGPEDDALMESVVHRMRHSGAGGGDGLNRQFDPQAFQGLLKVCTRSLQYKDRRDVWTTCMG